MLERDYDCDGSLVLCFVLFCVGLLILFFLLCFIVFALRPRT